MSQQALGISTCLRHNPSGLKGADLAEKVGMSRASIQVWLRRMAAEGTVMRYPLHGGPACVWTLTANLDATVQAYEQERERIARTDSIHRKRLRQSERRRAARYQWPHNSVYTEPQRPIVSVWELACQK